MPTAYCGMCDWVRRTDDESTTELDQAMIDHFVETGHSPVERGDPEAESNGGDPTDCRFAADFIEK
ncbi:hypothetical protein GS429_21495 [Natronorubrum sp. JWXQ-INN-674]|uniref:Uncharacterized protein n=1 Tax=Natronorubrum halalkaliphilum TaxID=2691917 RepID=A0A6B0VRW4_9EURY|nr:hypothetical protein [Natronorubrum halalkaliphilum]MXV64601.1 hypothetical protein [Natronorubrum halalkaliphilum]